MLLSENLNQEQVKALSKHHLNLKSERLEGLLEGKVKGTATTSLLMWVLSVEPLLP